MQLRYIANQNELTPALVAQLLEVWESAVRATHHFLTEEDICRIRARIPDYFPQMDHLVLCMEEGGIIPCAFLGVREGNIEMLFVHGTLRGQGLGRRLITEAVEEFGATRVDVNEQNPEGRGFYERMGFVVDSRSEQDAEGNPFPLLHMILDAK